MTFSYDKAADILYLTFTEAQRGTYIYVENAMGDILRLDRSTKKVIGCTILAFGKRAAKGRIDIPEIGPVPFNEVAEELLHR
jgi:uncharacterized protein YuzE